MAQAGQAPLVEIGFVTQQLGRLPRTIFIRRQLFEPLMKALPPWQRLVCFAIIEIASIDSAGIEQDGAGCIPLSRICHETFTDLGNCAGQRDRLFALRQSCSDRERIRSGLQLTNLFQCPAQPV